MKNSCWKYIKKANAFGALCGVLFLFMGCTTPIPFEAEPDADFRELDSAIVPAQFDQHIGKKFEQLQSVVFHFFGKSFTGMGYLSIDADQDAFALLCMTPSGITLFSIKGTGDELESIFLPPQMEEHGENITKSLSKDMQRIYLDWTPPQDAKIKKKKYYFEYQFKRGKETVRYRYAGSRHLLVKKSFSKGWRTQCVVRYYEYKEFDGKLYPTGIFLHNKRFHYKMIFRLKKIYPTK